MDGLAVVGGGTVSGGDSEPAAECVKVDSAEEKSSEANNSVNVESSSMTAPAVMAKIVPNPSENSFSRVVLTDWLVYPGSPENPKSEVLE